MSNDSENHRPNMSVPRVLVGGVVSKVSSDADKENGSAAMQRPLRTRTTGTAATIGAVSGVTSHTLSSGILLNQKPRRVALGDITIKAYDTH